MGRFAAMGRLVACLAGFLVLGAHGAHADPISSPYTVTDLGTTPVAPYSGYNPTFSTDASGNGVVIGPDGQAYPFSRNGTATPLPSSQSASLPVPEAAPPPSPYGQSMPNFSIATDATLYPNGIVTAIDEVVQNSPNYSWQSYIPYYVQQNPDGSWGQPVAMGGVTLVGPALGGLPSVIILGMDKEGDILVQTWNQQISSQFGYSVYNVNTNTSTDLNTLPALVNSNGFSYFQVFGMDNDGRILAQAAETGSGSYTTDLLLLSPAGVPSGPINMPEPGSLAVMALAMAAFAAHRARARKAEG